MENKIINDNELEQVSGGMQYANGTYVNYGSYIIYTVASGDVLSGISRSASASPSPRSRAGTRSRTPT